MSVKSRIVEIITFPIISEIVNTEVVDEKGYIYRLGDQEKKEPIGYIDGMRAHYYKHKLPEPPNVIALWLNILIIIIGRVLNKKSTNDNN